MTENAEIGLVPGRECGDCNVCCVALTIEDPALNKAQGYRCPNTTPTHGCTIYESRPQTCRTFYCGWRKLKWIREPLRPDLSGVLVNLKWERGSESAPVLGVCFTLLTNAALKAEGLAETISAAVAADVPVYLRIPGPPGYTSAQARINDVLRHPVATKDKAGVLTVLRHARMKGRKGDHVPIVLGKKTAHVDPQALL